VVSYRGSTLAGELLGTRRSHKRTTAAVVDLRRGEEAVGNGRRTPERSALYARVGLMAPSPAPEIARRKAHLPMDRFIAAISRSSITTSP